MAVFGWVLVMATSGAGATIVAPGAVRRDNGMNWRLQRAEDPSPLPDYRLLSVPFFEVRGGGVEEPAPADYPVFAARFLEVRGGGETTQDAGAVVSKKMHPAWEGDFVDVVVGACVGGVAGLVFSVMLSRLASAVVMAASNIAFSTAVIKLAQAQGFVTVHGKAIRDAAAGVLERVRALPVVRKLDARRRRRNEGRRQQRHRKLDGSVSFLNVLDGGGVETLEEIATRNEHAVLGVCVGFVYGMVKGANL